MGFDLSVLKNVTQEGCDYSDYKDPYTEVSAVPSPAPTPAPSPSPTAAPETIPLTLNNIQFLGSNACGKGFVIDAHGYALGVCLCGKGPHDTKQCSIRTIVEHRSFYNITDTVYVNATSCDGTPSYTNKTAVQAGVCETILTPIPYTCSTTGQNITVDKEVSGIWIASHDAEPYLSFGTGQVTIDYPSNGDCTSNIFTEYHFGAGADCEKNPSPCNASFVVYSPQAAQLTEYVTSACGQPSYHDQVYDSLLNTCQRNPSPQEDYYYDFQKTFYVAAPEPPEITHVFLDVLYTESTCNPSKDFVLRAEGTPANVCVCGVNETALLIPNSFVEAECSYFNVTVVGNQYETQRLTWRHPNRANCTGAPSKIEPPVTYPLGACLPTSTNASYECSVNDKTYNIYDQPAYHSYVYTSTSSLYRGFIGQGQVYFNYADKDSCLVNSFSSVSYEASPDCVYNPSPCNTSASVLSANSLRVFQYGAADCVNLLGAEEITDLELNTCQAVTGEHNVYYGNVAKEYLTVHSTKPGTRSPSLHPTLAPTLFPTSAPQAFIAEKVKETMNYIVYQNQGCAEEDVIIEASGYAANVCACATNTTSLVTECVYSNVTFNSVLYGYNVTDFHYNTTAANCAGQPYKVTHAFERLAALVCLVLELLLLLWPWMIKQMNNCSR
jgi:hypothetical protein